MADERTFAVTFEVRSPGPSDNNGHAVNGRTRRRRGLNVSHLVWALLLAAVIPWRSDVYFEGAVDSVVVAKAAISLVALLTAAVVSYRARRSHRDVPASPFVMLFIYLAVSVIGGFAHQSLVPAAVVAVRVAILCLAIGFLMTAYHPMELLRSLVQVIGLVVVIACLTGISSATQGRLSGAVPPVDPNELAFMAGMCFLWAFSEMLMGRESTRHLLAAGFCIAVVLLTGSRSGLAALSLAVVLMTLRATALTRRGFALVCMLGPVLAFVAFGTDVLSSLFSRGGERGVLTLSNRTIAWDAALTSDRDPWDTWFGAGLTQKHIQVPGQWWTTQLLDSSWISALVQSGIIGLIIVIVLSASTMVRSLTAPRHTGPFLAGCVAFLCARALLESGLFDATVSFMFLFVASLASRTTYPDGGTPLEGHPTHRIPDTVVV